jgi:PilZ domain
VRTNRRKDSSRIRFEPPFKARLMAIDGTWHRECCLIEVSDTGAQLSIDGPTLLGEEFFLLLSSVGRPVFRRCRRVWVNGGRTGVQFEKQYLSDVHIERSFRSKELISN